jgi:hypothetical protein
MGKLTVLFNSRERNDYLKRMLEVDGLSGIEEDPFAAYCPISLTSTPDGMKPILAKRQELLKGVLKSAGISEYDPGASSQFSPDSNKNIEPWEVYKFDSAKVAGARFFTGHNILPSTGVGNEMEKAVKYNRIAVNLLDRGIRISRMLPFRTIYLAYDNFEKQADDFVEVFEFLKQFEPGMGFEDERPVLLGFDKNTNSEVNLEKETYVEFPKLRFRYDGSTDILKLGVDNPEILYENNI